MTASFVYKRVLTNKGIVRRFWLLVRSFYVRLFRDPTCRMLVHGHELLLPLSHPLPDYWNRYPRYDRVIGEVAESLRRERGRVVVIDVGANIGDSVAVINPQEHDTVLAIEADPKYSRYLKKNWGGCERVTIHSCFCGDIDSIGKFAISSSAGTASIERSEEGVELPCTSVDTLVCKFPGFSEANLLKIDTDGHELEVLSGARQLLQKQRPILLVECDCRGDREVKKAFLSKLTDLREFGYSSMLVYDNFGFLLGQYSLDNLKVFSELLEYHLAGGCKYYDLLIMESKDACII